MGATTNAFKVLEAVIAKQEDGLTFSDIGRQTGLPKASLHRLIKELVALGALRFDPAQNRYRGGLVIGRLGAGVMSGFNLRAHTHPYLDALHRRTGHVATLGIRNGTVGVYLDKCESPDFGLKLHSEIGKDFPLHCTAMGKLLLAHAPANLQQQVFDAPLESHTPHTITDVPGLRAELAAIRNNGHALDREEITRGLICIAAPITGIDGRVIAAASCTFPAYLQQERGIERERDAVLAACAAASGQLT